MLSTAAHPPAASCADFHWWLPSLYSCRGLTSLSKTYFLCWRKLFTQGVLYLTGGGTFPWRLICFPSITSGEHPVLDGFQWAWLISGHCQAFNEIKMTVLVNQTLVHFLGRIWAQSFTVLPSQKGPTYKSAGSGEARHLLNASVTCLLSLWTRRRRRRLQKGEAQLSLFLSGTHGPNSPM